MERVRLIVGILAVFGLTTKCAVARQELLLDDDWRFACGDAVGAEVVEFDDSHWERVTLPHTWNNRDGQDGGNDYYRGIAWYRRRCKPDPKLTGQRLFLKFDGASIVADLFINGQLVGTHKGSFAAFCFDVTSYLRVGEDNVIAVKVNNARSNDIAPLSGDFTVFGGLYRDVHLLVLDDLSISPVDFASSGVYTRQIDVTRERAELEITTKVLNSRAADKKAKVRGFVSTREGKRLAEKSVQQLVSSQTSTDAVLRLTLTNPHLWNGRRDPYLYSLTVEVSDGERLTDRITQPLGLRFFRVDPQQGLFLNGKRYPLFGVNRHQDRLDKGWAIGAAEHDEDFKLIEELGCTGIRLAHYQQAQYFYDLCDRGGMLVWAELPLVNELAYSESFEDNARQQLTELIKQNYNHPSIIFWGLFNELHEKDKWLDPPPGWDLIPKGNELAKQLDPSRITTAAACIRPANALNRITDTIAFNRYAGWYFGSPTNWPGTLDELRNNLPGRAIGIGEYGAGASINQHDLNTAKVEPTGKWHPEEWQCTVHEAAWTAIQARPWLWCAFIWNMFDFAVDNRDEGDHPGRNDKGLVTYDRKTRKDAFYFYKANWTKTSFVYITSRRYANRTQPKTPVKIYSNCETVELKVNGKSQGVTRSPAHVFFWKEVALEPGDNYVEATGICKGKPCADSCSWKYELPPAVPAKVK